MGLNNELYLLSRNLVKIDKKIMNIRNRYNTRHLNPDGSYKPIDYKPEDEKELKRLLSERAKLRNQIKSDHPGLNSKILMHDLVGAFYK